MQISLCNEIKSNPCFFPRSHLSLIQIALKIFHFEFQKFFSCLSVNVYEICNSNNDQHTVYLKLPGPSWWVSKVKHDDYSKILDSWNVYIQYRLNDFEKVIIFSKYFIKKTTDDVDTIFSILSEK